LQICVELVEKLVGRQSWVIGADQDSSLTPRQRAASAAFSVALGRIAADVFA